MNKGEEDRKIAADLLKKGVKVDTVEDFLGKPPGIEPFNPATLDDTPPPPEPGIYFGMSDEKYHAIAALSNSGIKKLAASPMIFWADTPWLNAEKRRQIEEQEEEKAHHIFGKAYHCRIMEGASTYAQRYAVELDADDFPDCLESTAQIKAAIGQFEAEAFDRKGDSVGMKPVKPVSKVPDKMPDGSDYERAAVKADWIAQLIALDPQAQIFANLQSEHGKLHAGKTFLTADQHRELEIAALMVERDPEVRHAFKGGYAEVVLIWRCAKTGILMKAKVDYLKIKAMVDLKSIANKFERSIENAIRFEIASYKYNLQPTVYFEGAEAVRQLVRDRKAEIWIANDYLPGIEAKSIIEWTYRWASHCLPDEWLWVFQQKGRAPITRGVWFPRGVTLMMSKDIVAEAKRRFIKFSQAFGSGPWLDVKPIYTIADEEIPQSATDI